MYQAHFGLTAPFAANGIARDGRVYGGGARARLVQRLDHALARGNAIALVTGAPGTGKTTLAAHAVRGRGTRLAFGWIPHAPQQPAELLDHLLAEFDVTAEAHTGRSEPLRAWRQFLEEMAVTETAVCVLVEHADELGTDVLRTLESLTAADPSGAPGANLVLMARTPLAERLAQPGLEGLAQRVGANLGLEPLTAAETRGYLALALEACGAELDAIVDEAAVAALHARAGGVIRVLENLTECALTLAAERGRERVDTAIVDEAASELCCATAAGPAAAAVTEAAATLETGTVPPPDPQPEPAPATAAAAPALEPAAAPTGADARAPTASASRDVPVLTDTPAEAAEVPMPAEADEVPTLTDAVDLADTAADTLVHVDVPDTGADTLVQDALAAAAAPAPAQPERAAEAPAATDAAADDDSESDDLDAVANALAFEDFSNFVAESVFGDDELDDLGQTLAMPERAGPRHAKLTGS